MARSAISSTDGGGVPVGLLITPANWHDQRGLRPLLDERIVRAAAHTAQHLCLDKGSDAPPIARALRHRSYIPPPSRAG